ncbi:MAG: hypothetical protein WC009_11415 [Methylotenera sp.]
MTQASKLRLSLFLTVLCFSSFSYATDKFDRRNFQTKASFELAVDKSSHLTLGKSRIQSQSAFVSLAHGLPGNSDGLEIVFLKKPITEATLADVLNNEAEQLKKSDYATLVLFLDKQHKVWQVNLSYVIPGTTVTRTIAWKPDDLKKYFSTVTFDGQRVILKSKGNYSDAPSDPESIRFTWGVDLNLPVIREINR